MFDYYRQWRLIRRLSKSGIAFEGMQRGLNQYNLGYAVDLEGFVKDMAKGHWFYIWSLLSEDYINIQAAKDKKFLQDAAANNLVEIVTHNGQVLVHALPAGDVFAAPSNFLAGFFTKYKEVLYVLIAVILFFASWSPTARAFLQKHFANYVPTENISTVASTSLSFKAENYGGNLAINTTGTVTQTLVQNKFPPAKFWYSLATSTYYADDNLFHSQFDLNVEFSPGTVSEHPKFYVTSTIDAKCNVNQLLTTPRPTGMMLGTGKVDCISKAQPVIDNNFTIKYIAN